MPERDAIRLNRARKRAVGRVGEQLVGEVHKRAVHVVVGDGGCDAIQVSVVHSTILASFGCGACPANVSRTLSVGPRYANCTPEWAKWNFLLHIPSKTVGVFDDDNAKADDNDIRRGHFVCGNRSLLCANRQPARPGELNRRGTAGGAHRARLSKPEHIPERPDAAAGAGSSVPGHDCPRTGGFAGQR